MKHVHAAGLAHLDIRPDNIGMVMEADGQEHAYLVDWGLALRIHAKTGFRGSEAYASDAMMDALMSGVSATVEASMDLESFENTLLSVLHGGVLPKRVAQPLPPQLAAR